MKYKVLERFGDAEDNGFVYEVGWEYPRANHFVKQSRLDELSSFDNRQGRPLIAPCEAVREYDIEADEILEPSLEDLADPVVELPKVEEEPKKKSRKKK